PVPPLGLIADRRARAQRRLRLRRWPDMRITVAGHVAVAVDVARPVERPPVATDPGVEIRVVVTGRMWLVVVDGPRVGIEAIGLTARHSNSEDEGDQGEPNQMFHDRLLWRDGREKHRLLLPVLTCP